MREGINSMLRQLTDMLNGCIRPMITLIFAGAFVGFTAMGTISGELFATVAGMVITFWFKSRDEAKVQAKQSETPKP